jgi:hypothetical protein
MDVTEERKEASATPAAGGGARAVWGTATMEQPLTSHCNCMPGG